MTTTVPPALMSRSSWNTPRVARSSRLPVGSSATQDRRVVHQRARDRDPLLLAARELARVGPALADEPHLGQHPHHPRGDRVAPRAGDLERERDVLRRGAVLQQPEVLEHDAEPAAEPGDLVRLERR